MSEASYLYEQGMGALAERDFAEHEREQARKLREKENQQRALEARQRKRTIADLITLGVLSGTIEEHMKKLTDADNVSKQVKNVVSTKIGEKTPCRNCGRIFVKKSYNQVFCSNQKKKFKGMDCKSDYHNRVEHKVRPF